MIHLQYRVGRYEIRDFLIGIVLIYVEKLFLFTRSNNETDAPKLFTFLRGQIWELVKIYDI